MEQMTARTYDVAIQKGTHDAVCNFLLRQIRVGVRQEELCFALWRPSHGATRKTALVFDLVLPEENDRKLHGYASFQPAFLARAIRIAHEKGVGLAFMHSHFTPGWQSMSDEDVIAERDRIAPAAHALGLPLVGLTLGTDESWSARFWFRKGSRIHRHWCHKVRVVGNGMRVTYNGHLVPVSVESRRQRRTIDTWGETKHQNIARLRVGIVGTGSVGCLVAEAMARMGVGEVVLFDADRVKEHNRDRLLYAGAKDVGRYKVDLVAQNLRRSATAPGFRVVSFTQRIEESGAYLAALDCDILFVAVDRPLPKDLLNHIAYVHYIPVVFGGVRVSKKHDDTLADATWSVVVAAPGNRCLRCDGQYTTSEVTMERDGSLDDPTYIAAVGNRTGRVGNENVFPFSANVASLMVLEMIRLVIREDWWPQGPGKLHFSYLPARLTSMDGDCHPNCSIRDKTALGDLWKYPFLLKPGVGSVSRGYTRSIIRAITSWLDKFSRKMS